MTTQQRTTNGETNAITLAPAETFTWEEKSLCILEQFFHIEGNHIENCECFFEANGGKNWMEKRSTMVHALRTFLPDNWNITTLNDFSNEHQVENPDGQELALAAMSKVYQRPILLFMAGPNDAIFSVQEVNALGDESTFTHCSHVQAKYLMSRQNLKFPPIAILHRTIDNEDHYYRLNYKQH